MNAVDCAVIDTLINVHVHNTVPDAPLSVQIKDIRHPALVRARVHAWRIGVQGQAGPLSQAADVELTHIR